MDGRKSSLVRIDTRRLRIQGSSEGERKAHGDAVLAQRTIEYWTDGRVGCPRIHLNASVYGAHRFRPEIRLRCERLAKVATDHPSWCHSIADAPAIVQSDLKDSSAVERWVAAEVICGA